MNVPENHFDYLPGTLRIAGYDITVEEYERHHADAKNSYGEFSEVELKIRVTNSGFKQRDLDTILHEVNHAVFWAYGIEQNDKEERIISALGTAWAQIYRDNPWLLNWISEIIT